MVGNKSLSKKRIFGRLISCALLVMVFAAFGLMLPTGTAEAKVAPKLSASSVTLAYGGRQTIRLQNGTGKWSVEGDGIVRITKKTKTQITVAPVKRGTATIVCEAGKKKLRCRVKVLNNRVGSAKEDLGYAMVVGKSFSVEYTLPKGVSLESTDYDRTVGKVTVKTTLNKKTGKTAVKLKVKALKPGRFTLTINYMNGSEPETTVVNYAFINGFRGKTKAVRTQANYRKWRKRTISSMASADMSTWEMIDAIGMLISNGKYGNSGGVSGLQLWYGGNGTCISGAKMMKDFMNDLGVSCSIHFIRGGSATDIFGNTLYYASQHRNVRVKLGGKRYELNPQPGFPWPVGTVKR